MELQETCNGRLARLCYDGQILVGYRKIDRYTREQVLGKVESYKDSTKLYPTLVVLEALRQHAFYSIYVFSLLSTLQISRSETKNQFKINIYKFYVQYVLSITTRS